MIIYLIKNTPGVKKERPRTKTGLAVKWNGRSMPPGFDRLKVLVMMNSLQNIAISGVMAPDVDGIKIFDKDHQIT